MSNLTLFICGLAITLISGMGVILSQISFAYEKIRSKKDLAKEDQLYFDILKEETL